jgi:CubicO group peptidase (beta-lactamase class C family)
MPSRSRPPPFRRTKAVVVVHDGKVIAERYAAGIGVDTPLLGFSMTKSVVNALIGILTQQGLVTPSMPAPIPEWRGAADPRREIEVEHLMRMTTGLALDETNSGFDPSSQMVICTTTWPASREGGDDRAAGHALGLLQPDHAAAGADHPRRRRRPGADAGVRLARIVQSARHAQRDAGIRRVGTLQGSTYMLASARDWARFGLLYLNDGMVGGKRILHEDWVDFSAAATLDTDYGAGFWTNRSEHPNAKARVRLGIPRDAFFASGDLGQRIVIMPSQRLVVVRLGDSVDPTGDMRGLARLVKEVIAATPCNALKTFVIARSKAATQSIAPAESTAYRPTVYGPPFSSARHRPAGRECARETPSPWDGPAPARRAPRRLPAESSSGCRRR